MYIEDVVISNFIADFFIVFISCSVLKLKRSYPRILISSIIGVIYSVFYPYVTNFVFLYKISCLIVVTYFAVRHTSFKRYLLFVLSYSTCSFLLGGASFALLNSFKNYDITFEGVKIALILSILIFCISFREIGRFALKRRISASNGVVAEVFIKDLVLKLDCFNDTGNILVDSVTNKPVFLMSKDIALTFDKNSTRQIIVHTVSGDRYLDLFTIDKLKLKSGNELREYKNMPCAIADRTFDGYKLIYNENAL